METRRASIVTEAYETRAPGEHSKSGKPAVTPAAASGVSVRGGENGDPVPGGDGSVLEQIRERLSAEVGKERLRRYFSDGTTMSLDGERLDVTVPSKFMAEFLDRRFGAALRRAAQGVGRDGCGGPVTLRFRVEVEDRAGSVVRAVAPAPPGREAEARAVSSTGAVPVPRARADRRRSRPGSTSVLRHRLDDFVVGESNRLAHGAAVRLAESTGREKFSPLFIHGSCGLGKTHLLHGLASRYLDRHPHAVVRAITAEEFTNDYVMAVKNSRLEEFRRVYRGVDLLCLDDAHFLSNKEKTQTELLHTFDAIDLGGARIVLASDDHPREIRKMSEQLVSRFLSGAVVRLDPPDTDTRRSIILAIAGRRGLPIDPSAVDLICERGGRCGPGGTAGSVRDLEGMLTQVEAYFRLVPEVAVSGSVGVVLVRRALNIGESDARGERARPRRPVEVDRINAEVCRTLGVTVQEMMGVGRHPKVVLARSVISLLSRRLTNLSFPEIARRMGRPNHSTIITAKKRLEATIAENRSASTADWAGVDLGVEFSGMTAGEFVERIARLVSRSSD